MRRAVHEGAPPLSSEIVTPAPLQLKVNLPFAVRSVLENTLYVPKVTGEVLIVQLPALAEGTDITAVASITRTVSAIRFKSLFSISYGSTVQCKVPSFATGPTTSATSLMN